MFELNSKRQIDNIIKILANGYLNANDCSRLIADLRELSELNGGKTQFPMLNLYGDWSLHAQLDRSKISEKLKKIEEQFSIPEKEQSTSDLIAEMFSIRKFQEEIMYFESQIPSIAIFNNKNFFKDFVSVFLINILDKPLLQKDSLSQIENMYLKSCCIDPTNGQIKINASEKDAHRFVWVINIRNRNIKIYCLFCLDYPNYSP